MQTVTLSSNTSWYLYNFRASTIKALVAEGYRVVCLSPPDIYSHRFSELGAEWRSLPMNNAGANPIKDAALVIRFWRHYRELQPTVAFHFTVKNNVYGTWAASILGIPVVNNISGLGTAFIRQGLVPKIVRGLYRLSQPLAHQVFCQNVEDFELLKQRRLVPFERLCLLPGSGVNLERFHPDLLQLRTPGQALRLVYAGRMLTDKGLNELVEVVSRINANGIRCELNLYGFSGAANVSAIDEKTLQYWSQRPGIYWMGPTDAIEKVYAHADAVVLPSYREGMPRSLLEACAMGLPVVASNVPGCRNIVTDGFNGLLCEARSVQSLQATLEKLLAMNDDERKVMGLAGRARVEADFDEQKVVDATLKVLREIESAQKP